MHTQYWNTLISPAALQERLHDGNIVIVDCRFELGQPDAGRRAYQTAHLPGAVYAHLDDDLSGPVTATSGRHPLPAVNALSATFSRWGIDRNTQVINYDANNGGMAAARLWWLLRWLGHPHVAVLDGGFKAWQAAGLPLVSSTFTAGPREFVPSINPELLVDADTVGAQASNPNWRVLDARAAERYAGEIEPLDPVAGHVPGALNQPFTSNLGNDGRFLDAAVLRAQFTAQLGDTTPQHVINMCGSGVTACHNVLAMEAAGLHGAKLYAGSWSEWSKQSHRPVATGRQP